MRLRDRLRRLEEQATSERSAHNEAEEMESWLAKQRIDHREATSADTRHARSIIALLRVQDKLPEMSAGELIERIVSWRPLPEGGHSWTTVEREVALAIYNREEGTESMVCPSRWRESLEAGDDLRKKYNAIPEEDLAEGYVRLGQIDKEGDEEALAKWSARYEEGFGITDELVRRAVGPDVDEITDEERVFRLHEYIADAMYGKKGFRIHRHMRRIMEEHRGLA